MCDDHRARFEMSKGTPKNNSPNLAQNPQLFQRWEFLRPKRFDLAPSSRLGPLSAAPTARSALRPVCAPPRLRAPTALRRLLCRRPPRAPLLTRDRFAPTASRTPKTLASRSVTRAGLAVAPNGPNDPQRALRPPLRRRVDLLKLVPHS